MTDLQIEIKEIKETLKAMQAEMKRIEQYHPATYENSITNWVNYSTQGCSQEELLK